MRTLFGVAVIAAMTVGTAAPAQQAPVKVTIAADGTGPRIDRNIFGQFAENLGTGIYGGVWVGEDSPIPNVRGIRTDVVTALKALKVPSVRWPGGCFADEYHWRDGIGPRAKRAVTVNGSWGNALEKNDFGTDEFFDFIGQIGSEAYLSVNMGSGSVKEAAEWMAYMTADPGTTAGAERAANGHRAPYRVKFLGLGNESWSCGGAYTPDYYVDEMKRYARFARNLNLAQNGTDNPAGGSVAGSDPMQRIAVGPGGPDTAYTEAVMRAWKGHDWAWSIEGLSMHQYTWVAWPPSFASTGFGEREYATLVKDTLKMEDMIRIHSAVMDKYDPEKKVPLVIDEWGVWLAKLPGSRDGFLHQQNSIRDAIIASINLNMFTRHADRVRMTAIAQMVNVLQAMILTDGPKMVLTPTYHLFKMYVPFQDATRLPITFDAGTYRFGDITLPRVDGIAARGRDGKVWLALTNVDPNQPVQIDARIDGIDARAASGTVLTADHVDAINSYDRPDTVVPRPLAARVDRGRIALTLPPKSVAVLSISR
ncbi:alpha-L-arabinofuranosidase C-terminal domain-containing protein [Sphingomonas sp. BK235]|uniref:alpha-N-arabinofuranosidase n=1 Tax=Sphingomonas sp. BK235 TaxID=2512131 RepID=UPI0010507244|nr:alpha-L-arabinofuranosidase C-terminal domain-containing protein [Sphingomonas sp. BK235]TCP36596.1 alpha-N-arabinofuranosidase [Sphingomonas sp. BK235]